MNGLLLYLCTNEQKNQSQLSHWQCYFKLAILYKVLRQSNTIEFVHKMRVLEVCFVKPRKTRPPNNMTKFKWHSYVTDEDKCNGTYILHPCTYTYFIQRHVVPRIRDLYEGWKIAETKAKRQCANAKNTGVLDGILIGRCIKSNTRTLYAKIDGNKHKRIELGISVGLLILYQTIFLVVCCEANSNVFCVPVVCGISYSGRSQMGS